MKVGIIIHSDSGNTLQVGKNLERKLIAKGHSVTLERVVAANEEPLAKNISLQSKPDTDTYDMIILGAPVHAFSLSSVMRAYLDQLTTLKDKKVSCFVTQGLAKSWMGGNRAVKALKKLCIEKDAEPLKTGVINWSSRAREKQIEDMTDIMSEL